MKRIKSRLRSKIGNNRLDVLGILSMEHTLVNEKVTAGKFFRKKLYSILLDKNRKIIFFYKGKSTLL